MFKVKQLYIVEEDEDGHRYLIPKNEYKTVKSCLTKAERDLNNYLNSVGWDVHNADEDYIEELKSAVYDCYDNYERLEGEQVFVVLPEDIIEGEEIE